MDGWNTIVSFWGPAYFQGGYAPGIFSQIDNQNQQVSPPFLKPEMTFSKAHDFLASIRKISKGVMGNFLNVPLK